MGQSSLKFPQIKKPSELLKATIVPADVFGSSANSWGVSFGTNGYTAAWHF